MKQKQTVLSNLQQQEERLRAWHRDNPGRAAELNDRIDAYPTMTEKRAYYATLSKPDKDGLMDEYTRRWHNKQAPQGSIVKSRHVLGFNIVSRQGNSETFVLYGGIATVIGVEDGTDRRYVMLSPPWVNLEGQIIVFAEAQAHELEVIS